MKLEFKTLEFKIVEADKGKIIGYASTFGNVDLGLDIVDKGAFTKTLKENKGKFPILSDHDYREQIGWNESAHEDSKGLYVEGAINLKVQKGVEKFELAKQAMDLDVSMGLSIGYMTIKSENDRENPNYRRLKEVKLFEYSITAFPMNTQAAITSAKSSLEKLNLVLLYAKTFGYTEHDLTKALLDFGAASKENDPVQLDQSIKDIRNTINLFKRS